MRNHSVMMQKCKFDEVFRKECFCFATIGDVLSKDFDRVL